jgi:cellulose biosynthesis protein BcsQ
MSEADTAALVGVTGGAGTTRLCVELATTLARDGRDVAILDAAFATQGLEQYVPGHVERDLTLLVRTDDADSSRAATDLPVDVPGSVRAWPAYAAFEGIARAKTPEAAERFGAVLDEVASAVDHVLVDTPPVASNQAVAAVTAADRVGLLAPASERGTDALQRLRGRVDDVGATVDCTVANERPGADGPGPDADVTVPESETRAVTEAPVCADPGPGPFPPAVGSVAETLLDVSLTVEYPDGGRFGEGILSGN